MRRNTVLQSDLPKNARAVFERKIDGRVQRQGRCVIATFQPSTPRPSISIGGRNLKAHQWAYLIYRGSIPAGMNVCHTCDVPRCINPEHLWVGTQAENMADMTAKGRRIGRLNTSRIGPFIPRKLLRERRRLRRLANPIAPKQKKIRNQNGARNPNARLTEADARELLALRGCISVREAAERFGLGQAHVYSIWTGRRWAHLHTPTPNQQSKAYGH